MVGYVLGDTVYSWHLGWTLDCGVVDFRVLYEVLGGRLEMNLDELTKDSIEKIDWEMIRDRANACWENTMKDAQEAVERRKRVVSEAWFSQDEKELAVLTHQDRCFVMYVENQEDEGHVATDPVTSEPDAEIWFELDNGQMDMHKRLNTVPACVAFRVVEHFVKTGDMLSSVVWIKGNKKEEEGDNGCC